jgi:hypothetical protein
MFDLTVVARGGRWLLLDDEDGELGAFDSRAAALSAARDYQPTIGEEPRYVLVQEYAGEWEEALVEPPALH